MAYIILMGLIQPSLGAHINVAFYKIDLYIYS